MKKVILLLSLILSTISYAQYGEHCANLKSNSRIGLQNDRSNTLSLAEIATTEEYDVHFYKLDLNAERTSTYISGEVEIHGKVVALSCNDIIFELHQDLTINSVELNGVSTNFTHNGSVVTLQSVNLTINDNFIVKVDYQGQPPSQATNPLSGGGINNGTSGSWGNQVTWTLSEPFSAYEWWPCKQSLTDKADSVYVYLTTDSTNKVGANGLLNNVIDLGNGKHRYEWQSNYPIDYYLISFTIAKYVDYSIYAHPAGLTDSILVQNYVYDNPNTLPNFQNEIDNTVDFIEHFSDLYGLYPFFEEKYGHCMAPFGGGMEHQTMTTQGWFEDGLTAHELGHQWFGDHVTCATWADIWLNEGFASYTEYLMEEEFYPGSQDQSMLNVHDDVMSEDFGQVWVADSLNTNRIFSGRLTYNKGSAIIHTLRFLINDDAKFFEILQTYLSQFGGSTARLSDFKQIAEDISQLDLTDFFQEWYYGEGFPTYSIQYNSTGLETIIEVSQSTSWPTTTPFFTNDLELKLVAQNGSIGSFRIPISGPVTNYSVPFVHPISQIKIDPNNWIINQDGFISNNTDLLNLTELNKEFTYLYNRDESIFSLNSNIEGELKVYNMNGQLIHNFGLVNGSNQYNFKHLSSGVYIVSFGEQSFKIVK